MSVSILVALGLAALGAYALAMSRVADRCPPSRQWGQFLAFCGGLIAALLAFVPSPALLGANHRFTTNMGQLLLMLEVAAPLLLLGLRDVAQTPPPRWEALGRRLTAPLLAGVISSAVLVGWHLPALFEKASGSLAIWSFKEVLLLGVGLLAWSPVAAPLAAWRAPRPVQLLYLFVWRIPMVTLGAVITFANGLIYTGRSVGLEICAPASLGDQQAAGLVMLAVSGLIVFGTFSVIFFRWFAEG
jgi:putative membrane protein